MTAAICCRYRSRYCLWALLAVFVVTARAPAASPVLLTSASRQFVVRGQPQRSIFSGTRSEVVYVDPAMLVMVGERLRQALQRELGWGDAWQGSVFVEVRPVQRDNERAEISAWRTPAGWRYRMNMPDETDRRALIESLTEVLLLEFANRHASDRCVELPPWLVPGLAAHLLAGELSGLELQARSLKDASPHTVLMRKHSRSGNMDALRQHINSIGALTVDQLNWPEFDPRDRNAAAAYRACAHLFVRELFKLRGGVDCLVAALAFSPEHMNWQTAFLRGFEPHFQRMLDLEKWWSLAIVQAKTREQSILWSAAESRSKIEEILYTATQVRLTKAELPHVMPASLQTVLADWEFSRQQPVLREKIAQLQAIRIRLPPEFAELASAYRSVLENYLEARAGGRGSPTRAVQARSAKVFVADAIAQLNALDERRAQWRTETLTAAAPSGEAPLTHPRPNL